MLNIGCSRSFVAGSSIQWGAWAGVGMAHGNAAVLTRVERSGMGLVLPTKGLEALLAVLGSRPTQHLGQVRSRLPSKARTVHGLPCCDGQAAAQSPRSVPCCRPLQAPSGSSACCVTWTLCPTFSLAWLPRRKSHKTLLLIPASSLRQHLLWRARHQPRKWLSACGAGCRLCWAQR